MLQPKGAARPNAPPCDHCGTPLAPIERHRGHCGAVDCRRAADAAARRRADASLGRGPAGRRRWVATIWPLMHRVRLVPLRTAERSRHAAWLASLVAAAPAPTAAQAPAPHADGGAGGALCAFCRGRCCRQGASSHAFVDRALLQRRAAAEGVDLGAVAAGYLERLPAHHVEGSCLYHGVDGCALPREMRADICNAYACDALEEARSHVAAGATALVAAMEGPHGVERVAWLQADGRVRPLRR